MSNPVTPIRAPGASSSWDDYRLLVESVADYAIFMLDPEGRVATWNVGASRIKGYSADEIIGRSFTNFYPPEDIEARKPQRELAEAIDVGRVEDEGWRVRKDGTRFWANVVITALRDETGLLRGFAKVTRDLTQRRQADEALRESELRFRLLVESVGDYAIYMLDPQGRVTTWNLGAQRLKGYSAAEIMGRSFEVFFPAEDVAAGKPTVELTTARDVGRFEEEAWRVRKDGARFWASVILTAVRDANGELLGFAKVTRDLTIRREAEEIERRLVHERAARAAAEQVARAAEEANRIKDEFLATVSHELRTPLNAIVGWTKMVRRQSLDPGLAKAIEVIDRNADAQLRIVEDLLDVSRIITGKLRLDPRPVDMGAIVRHALEVIRPAALAKQIAVSLETPPEPCLVVGDAERLQQVAWNLLSNAVKFTPRDGALRVTLRHEARNVELEVGDTGAGIDPGFLPFVFDRFKQADSSTTRRIGGLGLGLSLVRHIVELHGGSVAVSSPGLGQGSTFTISLPDHAPAESRAGGQAAVMALGAAVPEEELALAGRRILVVDDDTDSLELLATVLGAAGAIVHTAQSAADAYGALPGFDPDLLISDIGMADEDGYSLIRRVRRLDPTQGGGVPAIALTAYTRGEDRDKALAAGFTTHVSKPIAPEELIAVVASLAPAARA